MEAFSLSAGASSSGAGATSALSVFATTRPPSILHGRRWRSVSFHLKHKFLVFASNEQLDFNEWDKMEIELGKMIEEDSRLNVAKINDRRLDPGASFLELEKPFYENKGELTDAEVIPLDWDMPSRQVVTSLGGLNLVNPVLEKGVKFESSNKPDGLETRKPNLPVRKPVVDEKRSTVTNGLLRKPTTSKVEGVEEKSLGLRFEPNLSLDTGNSKPDAMSLKKPEPSGVNKYGYENQELSDGATTKVVDYMKLKMAANENVDERDKMMLRKPIHIDKKHELSSTAEYLVKMVKEGAEVKRSGVMLLKKPQAVKTQSRLERKYVQSGIPKVQVNNGVKQNGPNGISERSKKDNAIKVDFGNLVCALNALLKEQAKKDNDSDIGLNQFEHSDVESTEKEVAPVEQSANSSVDSDSDMKFSVEAALQGKPKRIDQPAGETSKSAIAYTDFEYPGESYGSDVELEHSSVASPLKELEDNYWTRAEELVETRKLEEVVLIRSCPGGFVVSFGPLLGFLPYSNLTSRWKFIAFETWLRRNGLDPSTSGENVGIIQSYDIAETNLSPEIAQKTEGGILPDMGLEDLRKIYEQKKHRFVSSLVGQRQNASVKVADRKSQKLIFSLKPEEEDDLVEKKKKVMAKLQIGDVVKCHITKIAYFGVFVEVEGVPALIHLTEVSWDATLNPASYLRTGQMLEAKVIQLNFERQRIYLSLRERMPDPLSDTLEYVIGDDNSFDGRLQAAKSDTEWADVESLIKELQQIKGVQSASKGQFFLSPDLAPTFQVCMTSRVEDGYKLLARAGNKVQEVIVRTTMDKDEMKAAILACTNRL